MARECDTCGGMFQEKGDWQRTCFNCFLKTPKGQEWKREKDRREGKSREPPPNSGTKTETRTETVYRNAPGLDVQMVRRLLQLCHPDKHDGSEASVKATQWLNDRLRELKP